MSISIYQTEFINDNSFEKLQSFLLNQFSISTKVIQDEEFVDKNVLVDDSDDAYNYGVKDNDYRNCNINLEKISSNEVLFLPVFFMSGRSPSKQAVEKEFSRYNVKNYQLRYAIYIIYGDYYESLSDVPKYIPKNCKDIITLLLSPSNGVFQPVECEEYNSRIIKTLPKMIINCKEVKNYDNEPPENGSIKNSASTCIII